MTRPDPTADPGPSAATPAATDEGRVDPELPRDRGSTQPLHESGQDEDDGFDPDCFDIYETPTGLRPVGSAVRRRILSNMRGGELTVPEMIEVTGLGKSTISTHLAFLYKESLVAYREDPKDRRKKRYFLTARYVGMSCTGDPRAGSAVEPMTQECLGKPGGVAKALLRSFVAELRTSGLDLDPLLSDTGRRVGETIGRLQPAPGVEDWFASAARFWDDNNLGKISVEEEDGLVMRVDGCRLCCEGDGGFRMCGVTAGILEGMASEALRTAVQVQPVDSATAGAGDKGSGATHDATGSDAPSPQPNAPDPSCSCAFRLVLPLAEAEHGR